MTPEDEKYYQDFFALFLTDGWKHLVDKCQAQIDGYNIANIKDEAGLRVIQGELNILTYLTNLEDVANIEYENAKEEARHA